MKTVIATLFVLAVFAVVGLDGLPQDQALAATVLLRVQVDNRTPAEMSIPDDAIGTVTLPAGRQFGVQPHVDGSDLEIRILERAADATQGVEEWREARTFRVSSGTVARFEEDGLTLDLEWLGLAPGQAQIESQSQCCVTCQQVRYCACAVETACGDCCEPACCGDRPATGSSGVPGTLTDASRKWPSCRSTSPR